MSKETKNNKSANNSPKPEDQPTPPAEKHDEFTEQPPSDLVKKD